MRNEENRRWKSRRKRFFFFPFAALLYALLIGWLVQWLWNAILPGLIPGVGYITYWKAVGVLVLTRLLFGGWGGWRGRQQWHERGGPSWRHNRWANMSDEERIRLRDEWRTRCRERWEGRK